MNRSGLENNQATNGITVDSKCNLYTTNSYSGDVTGGPEIDIFPATTSGGGALSAAIGGSLTQLGRTLLHVAVDSTGKIYAGTPQSAV